MTKTDLLTSEAYLAELEALRESEFVKLAQKEQRIKSRARKLLYDYRWLDKRGRTLAAAGGTLENLEELLNALERGDDAEM